MDSRMCEIAVVQGGVEARQKIEKGEPFVVRGWINEKEEILKELGDSQHLIEEYGDIYVDAMVAVGAPDSRPCDSQQTGETSSTQDDMPVHFAGNISDHVSRRIRLADVLEGCIAHKVEHDRRDQQCSSEGATTLAYYVAQQPLTGELESLGNKFPLPADLFPCGASVSRHLWISSYPSKSSLHFDAQCNMLCVVNGRKTVRLARPEDVDNAYPIWTEQYNHSRGSMLCCRGPVYQASIYQGDAIHIPKHWWHEVESGRCTIAVNFWWDEQPHSAQLQHESQQDYFSTTLIPLKEAMRTAILRQVDMLVANVPRLPAPSQGETAEKETLNSLADERAVGSKEAAKAHAEHIVRMHDAETAVQKEWFASLIKSLDATTFRLCLLRLNADVLKAVLHSCMCPIVAELLTRKFEEPIPDSAPDIQDDVFFRKLYHALDSGNEAELTAAKILEQKEKLHELCYKSVLQKYLE